MQVLDLSCNKLERLWSKPPAEQSGSDTASKTGVVGDEEEDDEDGEHFSRLPDGLEAIPFLHTLYLHGNNLTLSDPRDLQVLGNLKVLRKLSLHGNPCEESPSPAAEGAKGSGRRHQQQHAAALGVLGYRLSILKVVPQLRELDFTSFTQVERMKLSRILGKVKGYGATLSATAFGEMTATAY